METDWPRIRRLLLTMIIAGLLCRLTFVLFTPVFQAPDEEEHFNYIRKLATEHAFPVMAGMGGDAAKDWEYEQPPLYYLLLTPVFDATQAAGLGLEATVRVLRLGSVLFWALNVWLGTVLLRRLQIKDGFVWIFALGMLCLLPTYTFVSSAINNDNLMAVLGTSLLCVLAMQGKSLKHSVALGVLLGLALLAKKSAIVFFPAIVLLPMWSAWRGQTGKVSALMQVAVPLALAMLFFIPWAWRDWHVYGTLNPETLAAPRKVWSSPVYGIGSAIHNLVKTFWAVSGITNNVGYPFPLAGEFLMLLAFVPASWWKKSQFKGEAPIPETAKPTLWVFLMVAGIAVALVLRFGYLLGMGQGRHLFAVLLPIALLLAIRLRRLPVAQPESLAAAFWIVYAFGFTAFSLVKLC